MKIADQFLLGIIGSISAFGQEVVFKPYREIAKPEPAQIVAITPAKPIEFKNLPGMTVWFVPNPKRLPVFKRAGFSIEKEASIDDTFYPEAIVKFTVDSLISSPGLRLLGVRFADGRSLYLRCTPTSQSDDLRLEGLRVEEITEKEISMTEYRLAYLSPQDSSTQETIFISDPKILKDKFQDIKAVKEKALLDEAQKNYEKHKRAAAAWAVKGPARIGMTKAQAIASNWGRPSSINKTINKNSVSEQWVYSGNSYLYFTNGVLTSIQTSE